MPKTEKDINGKDIKNAIGYCKCEQHPGALSRELAFEHKCMAKRCPHLVKYNETQWRKKQGYKNRR